MRNILVLLLCFSVCTGCTLSFMLTNNHTDGSNDVMENDSKMDQEIDPEIELPIKGI